MFSYDGEEVLGNTNYEDVLNIRPFHKNILLRKSWLSVC
jgi:hypothetical protein